MPADEGSEAGGGGGQDNPAFCHDEDGASSCANSNSTASVGPDSAADNKSETKIEMGDETDTAPKPNHNGVNGKSKNGDVSFLNSTVGSNGSANDASDKKEQVEAVNLELVSMKPYNGSNNAQTKNQEACELPVDPYEEYFVPVNEHRKYISRSTEGEIETTVAGVRFDLGPGVGREGLSLRDPTAGLVDYSHWLRALRGEKLYVTKDKRSTGSYWKRVLCWGFGFFIVAIAAIFVILIATGIIPTREGMKPLLNGEKTTSRKLDITQESKSHEYMENPPPSPPPIISTAPTWPTTDETLYTFVPRALDGLVTLNDLEWSPAMDDSKSRVYRDVAKEIENSLSNMLKINNNSPSIKVYAISRNGEVKFRINQPTYEKPEENQSYFEKLFRQSGNALGKYRIKKLKVDALIDQCQSKNFECSDGCVYDYVEGIFKCVCPAGKSLDKSGKKCMDNDVLVDIQGRSKTHDDEFHFTHNTKWGGYYDLPTIEPETDPESIAEPTAEPKAFAEPTSEPKPSAEPKSEPEPPTPPESEPEPPSEPVSESEPSAEPKSEPEPSAEPTSHTEPSAEPASEKEPSAEPESEPKPSAEPKSEPKPSAEPASDAEPSTEPASGSEPSAEPKGEPEPSAEPEGHAEPSAEPESHAEPSSEPTAKSEPSAEPNSEQKAQPEPTTHAQPPAGASAEQEPSAEPKIKSEFSAGSISHSKTFTEPASEPEPSAEPKSEPEPAAEPTNHGEASAEPTAQPEPSAEPNSEPKPRSEPTIHAEPTAEPNSEPEFIAESKSKQESAPESHAEPTSETEPSAEPKPRLEPTSHAEPSVEPTSPAEPSVEPLAEPTSEPEPRPEPGSEPEPSPEPASEPEPSSEHTNGHHSPITIENESEIYKYEPTVTSTSEPPTVIGLKKNIEITTEPQKPRNELQESDQPDQIPNIDRRGGEHNIPKPFLKHPLEKPEIGKTIDSRTGGTSGSENNEEAYNDITDESFPGEFGKNSAQPAKNSKKDEKRLQKTYRQHKITDHLIPQVTVNKPVEPTHIPFDKHSEEVSMTSQVPVLPIEIQMDITTEAEGKSDSSTSTHELVKETITNMNPLKAITPDTKTTAQIPILPDEIQTTDNSRQEHTEPTVNFQEEKTMNEMLPEMKNESTSQQVPSIDTATTIPQKFPDQEQQEVTKSKIDALDMDSSRTNKQTTAHYDSHASDPNAENDIKPVTEDISGDTPEVSSYQFALSATDKTMVPKDFEELDEAELRVVPLGKKDNFEQIPKLGEEQMRTKKNKELDLDKAGGKDIPILASATPEDNDTEDVPLKTIYILSSFNGSDTPQHVTSKDEMTTIPSHVDPRKLIPVSEATDDTFQTTESTVTIAVNDQQTISVDSQKLNQVDKDYSVNDEGKEDEIGALNKEVKLNSNTSQDVTGGRTKTIPQTQHDLPEELDQFLNEPMNGESVKSSPSAVSLNTSEIYFSKCKSGQFQCTNGTSRDGAYCVSLSAKCDSENDCSDGSDEMNCKEEGCPGNFQCASGQCLKRHLVCNGIVDCDDGSDEKECGKWTCKFDEFQCPNGRCIPSLWQCNGRPDCENHADEYSCSESCGNDEYLCPTERWCIPQTWRCNGVSECLNGEDEKLCDCAVDQFRCGSGGCIPAEQLCDGVENCPDRSDEWNCLGDFIRNSSSSVETDKDSKEDEISTRSSLIRIKQSNGEYRFICSDGWSEDFSDQYCRTLGFASSETTQLIPQGSNKNLLQLVSNSNPNSSLVTNLERVVSCKSEKIVEVSCREFTCGSHENVGPTARLVGGTPASEGQWSSVALLKEPKHGAACTASVLSPLHALASYSCIYSHRQSSGWQLFVGGNLLKPHKVKNIVPYPQVKYNQFLYNNDIAFVELEEPLTFSRNVSAVCLPSQLLQPRQLCVTAGWGFPVNGEVDLQQYLKFLPVPTYDSQECNATSHYAGFITKHNICAGFTDTDKGPCYNDEGAPLMCVSESGRWEIQGLLSHHSRCSRGHPAIYSSLAPALSWLRNSIPALQIN
ncbi:hypothetical protein QAD02_004942 [Eretmocerus hayati]|uniref:Uncharacterized protein n=1 Tax=Eretmocerus hayati TaxID=131215 RepID=A0ACC2NVV1_9HYME|nr:hypothetical protein QAD02_004942 [Eretmocerus hayati]